MPSKPPTQPKPTVVRIEQRLSSFPSSVAPLTAVCRRYLKHCSAQDDWPEAHTLIGHTPWQGSTSYAIDLFPGAKKNWFSMHSKIYGVNIPTELRPLLSSVNGFSVFGVTLFGMLMMRLDHPVNIATANRQWKQEYRREQLGFHFGARSYSPMETLGYFLGADGGVSSCLKSGERIAGWPTITAFLQAELAASERNYRDGIPANWWH